VADGEGASSGSVVMLLSLLVEVTSGASSGAIGRL
jgi:hypothetical protein